MSSPTSARKAAERVQRGAALLDRVDPSWRPKVKRSELNLSSPGHCIVGQVFGGYNDGLEMLGLRTFDKGFNDTSQAEIDHGFERGQGVEYWELEREWLKELDA